MKKGSIIGSLVKYLVALAILAAAVGAIAWRFWPESAVGRAVDGPMRVVDEKVREWTGRGDAAEESAAAAPDKSGEAGGEDAVAAKPSAGGEGVPEGDESAAPGGKSEPEGGKQEAAKAESSSPWEGLVEANRIQGMKQTEKTLKGKVVLVCEFANDQPDSMAVLPRVQQTWQSFRGKPFMLLGSLRSSPADAGKKSVRDVAFPVYRDLRYATARRMRDLPFFYVIAPDGKIVWSGRSDCEATEAVVEAIGATVTGGLGGTKQTPDLKSSGLKDMKNSKSGGSKLQGGSLQGPTPAGRKRR